MSKSLRWATLAVLALTLTLSACKEDDGSFSVVFRWEDGEPDGDIDLFVVARVEEDFESGEGRTLASAGPELLEPGMQLDFDDVPIGADRRVVVEVREAAGSAALVLYYGISESFDMAAGDDTVVEVRLQLARTPGGLEGVGVSIADTPSPGVAASTQVKLRVVSDSAMSVELSNRAGLPMGSSQRFDLDDDALADEQPEDEALKAHEIEWDLDMDLDEPCGEVDFCDRRVFARFEDEEGYLSRIFSAEITVDSKPPGVVEDSIALSLDPANDNVLVQEKRADLIKAVTAGTKVTLVFALDEQVIDAPQVRAVSADGESEPLVFEHAERSSYVFRHEYEGTDPMDAVSFDVEVTATDKAGTEATFTLGSFVVDTVPPDAPAEPDDEPTLVYERRPWGSDATGELSFAVRASPGSITPGSSVFFYDGPDIESAQRLGFLDRVDDDGGFSAASLARADAPEVYVRVVDDAGNGAQRATLVRDVEWTASLAGHVVGEAGSNPNSFESRAWSLGALRQNAALRSDGDPIAKREAPVSVRGAGRWQRAMAVTTPTPRSWPGMTYDAARGRVVLFGGSSAAFDSNTTCDDTGLTVCAGPSEWDGTIWRTPELESEKPAPSDSPRATWDSRRGRTMLFGGKGAFGQCGRSSSFCSQLWAYDGERFDRLDEGGDGEDAPQGRSNHILVYDPRRDRIVLYGGASDETSTYCEDSEIGVVCRDTWEWDGARWELVVGNSPPGGRLFATAAYDEKLGKVVMFGGEIPGSPPLPETWAWDGESWEQVDAPAEAPPQPSGRLDGSMTYSRKLGRVVLFGGQANDIGSCDGGPMFDYYCGALWSFTGSYWERIEEPEPQLSAPIGRSRAGLAEDAFGNLVLFGGDRMLLGPAADCTQRICPGLWVWEGKHWRLRTAESPAGAVQARFNHSAAYDASTGSSYMFGGRRVEVATMCPGDAVQTPLLSISPFYLQDLWRWDGNAWAQVTTMGVEPGKREGAAMASMESTAPVLTGGGAWHFDGLTPRPAAGAERVCGGIIDPAERGLYSQASWTIDGDTLVDTAASLATDGDPEVRGEAAIAGEADDELVMFGGARECSELGDTWRYDGDGWQQVSGTGGPDARRSAGLAYDRARDQLVLFGGGTAYSGDPGANEANAADAGCTRCRCAEGGTFLLEGDAWSSADTDVEPAPRWNGAMAYVDARESVLLTGGVAPSDCGQGSAKCGDTWEWNGESWHQLQPADPEGDGDPNPRDEHTMIEDRARDELVMMGGTLNSREFTWLWHSGADAHPEQLAHFAFDSTQAPPGVEIRSVALDWEASAESSEGDEVRMLVWHHGQLVPVDELGFTRDRDRWSADDADLLTGLAYGPNREIVFAIRPAADNGTHPGYASLETRFTELLVSYRLPAPP